MIELKIINMETMMMNKEQSTKSQNTPASTLIIINRDELVPIIAEAISKVLPKQQVTNQEPETNDILGDFISQKDAMKTLGRKTTWFYNMRTNGKLRAMKAANQWWYKKDDIKEFINNGSASY